MRWWITSLSRAIRFAPQRFILAAILLIALPFAAVLGVRYVATANQLARFASSEFIALNTQETRFWLAGPGKQFEREARDGKLKWNDYAYEIYDKNNFNDPIFNMAGYHDELAACVNSGLCAERTVCKQRYELMCNFYAAYRVVFDRQYKYQKTTSIEAVKRFLSNSCPIERQKICESIGYEYSFCQRIDK